MKKLIIVLFVLSLICGMNIKSFAQVSQVVNTKKTVVNNETFSGKIISINAAKNELTLTENKTAAEKIIVATSKAVSALKVGEEVRVTLKKGSNIALSIKKIVQKNTSTKTK